MSILVACRAEALFMFNDNGIEDDDSSENFSYMSQENEEAEKPHEKITSDAGLELGMDDLEY